MTETEKAIRRNYPRTLRLPGGQELTLRLMKPTDKEAMVAFARSLPPHDLLFLRMDITRPDIVQEWAKNLRTGRTVTVLAERDGEIAGFGSLHHDDLLWTRHVGEVRVIVGTEYRGRQLGPWLAHEAFVIAKNLGLKKITVQMTTDQQGARRVFEKLGFRPEALLPDHVVDRAGKTHDLLIMAHDVEGLTDTEVWTGPARSAVRP